VRGIFCDHVQIKGGVFLSEGFEAADRVSFDGASIAGSLVCNGSRFSNPGGDALSCLHAQIINNVFLSDGFTANGGVSFANSRIGGGFSCVGGHFNTPMAAPARPHGLPVIAANALDLQGVRITGVLRIGPEVQGSKVQEGEGAIIEGSLNLRNAYAGEFADDPKSWPPAAITLADGKAIPCVITLDGFVYDNFGKGTCTDLAMRKQWLLRQPPEHLGKYFLFQPFNQLHSVFRNNGQKKDAIDIDYFKNYCFIRRSVNRHRIFALMNGVKFPFYWLFVEKMLGYGYKMHRLAALLIVVVLGCGLVYDQSAYSNMFVPSNPEIVSNSSLRETCATLGKPGWINKNCLLKNIYPEYSSFYPYMYALALIIPVIDTGIKRDWQPIGAEFYINIFGYKVKIPENVLPALVWGEMIFAWVWTLSLAVLGWRILRESE
jgi:hypothetical protein